MYMKRRQKGPRLRGLLAAFVDQRQREGRYTFTEAEFASRSPQSPAARRQALWRLERTGRIVRPMPKHGFFVIVPHEFHSMGSPPISWYLDALLRHLDLPCYYVGLLTAAQWHGATHVPVQETQVVVPRQLRPMRAGRERIRFFTKSDAAATAVETQSNEAAAVRVSTPEATAADLVRYMQAVGGLNAAATALAELGPRLGAAKLRAVLEREGDPAAAQRLGHILESVGAGRAATSLGGWLARVHPRVRPLDPRAPAENVPRDARWNLWVNAKVEPAT